MEMIPYIPEYETEFELTEEQRNLLVCWSLAAAILLGLFVLDDICSPPIKQDEGPEPTSEAIVLYGKPSLRPRPTKAPKTDNEDVLDKPILKYLSCGPGVTAKEISVALRNVPGGAEKSLINSRLYTLMNKGLVKKAQGSGSAPRWMPNPSPEFNTIVFGQ